MFTTSLWAEEKLDNAEIGGACQEVPNFIRSKKQESNIFSIQFRLFQTIH